MATSTSIPLSECLNTSYRPDCDYIDGEVKERTLGERPHALLQSILVALFNLNRRAWNIVAATELRVRVSATHVRIPMFACYAGETLSIPWCLLRLSFVSKFSRRTFFALSATVWMTTLLWVSNTSGSSTL